MSDPTLPEGAIEVGKVAGSGGLGFLIAKLADRWFSKADKDAGKLDLILAAVSALTSKFDVLTERVGSTRLDVDKLEAKMDSLTERVTRLEAKA